MATCTVSVGLHRKWLVMPSVRALSLFCRVSGYAPNLERLATWYAGHGFDLTVDGKRTRLGAL